MAINVSVSVANVIPLRVSYLELPAFVNSYKFPRDFESLAGKIELALRRFDMPLVLELVDSFNFSEEQRLNFLIHFERMIQSATYDLMPDTRYKELAMMVYGRIYHNPKLSVKDLIFHISGVMPAAYPFTEVPCI